MLAGGAVGGRVVLHLLRAYGRVLVRVDRFKSVLAKAGLSVDEPEEEMPEIGHAPGTSAPAFSLRDVLGETVTLDGLLEAGRPLLLLFTSPTCGPCQALMSTVAGWQREHAEALTIALVSDGAEKAIRADAQEHTLARVLIDKELAVYGAYQANGTPSAVLVSPDGEIASWVASGSDGIKHLASRALTGAMEDGAPSAEGLPAGEPVPQIGLPDLEGGRVELAELRGADAVLLFWNPACGFCRAMYEDLLSWEANPPDGAPALVIISSGAAEETAGESFASRVLLDAGFEAGKTFRAGGTPMAVRIDADGKVASPLAAGPDAVRALLGR